jgi:hypothetical protein
MARRRILEVVSAQRGTTVPYTPQGFPMPFFFLFTLISLAGCGGPTNKAGSDSKDEGRALPGRQEKVEKVLDRKEAIATLNGMKVLLERKAVLERKLVMLVPRAFTSMRNFVISKRFGGERFAGELPPTAVCIDRHWIVYLRIYHTKKAIWKDSLSVFQKKIADEIDLKHPPVKWIRNEMTAINGRKVFALDFRTRIPVGPKAPMGVQPRMPGPPQERPHWKFHELIVGTNLEGRLLLVRFTIPEELEKKWVPIANQMMQSLTVKDPIPLL